VVKKKKVILRKQLPTRKKETVKNKKQHPSTRSTWINKKHLNGKNKKIIKQEKDNERITLNDMFVAGSVDDGEAKRIRECAKQKLFKDWKFVGDAKEEKELTELCFLNCPTRGESRWGLKKNKPNQHNKIFSRYLKTYGPTVCNAINMLRNQAQSKLRAKFFDKFDKNLISVKKAQKYALRQLEFKGGKLKLKGEPGSKTYTEAEKHNKYLDGLELWVNDILPCVTFGRWKPTMRATRRVNEVRDGEEGPQISAGDETLAIALIDNCIKRWTTEKSLIRETLRLILSNTSRFWTVS